MTTKQKKIIFITTALNRGGAEVLLLALSRRLKERYDVQVATVVGGGALETEFAAAGIPVQIFHKTGKFGFAVLVDLIKFLKSERPDIVHTHLFAGDTWGRLAAWIAGVPRIISTEHNINADEGMVKLVVKRALTKVTDKVIVISKAVERYAQDVLSIDPAKITLIYNGIDLTAFDYRGAFEYFKQGVIRAVCVGQLREQKGHTYVLQALPGIVARHPGFHLDIIGGGERQHELAALATDLGVRDHVRFLGSQPVTGDTLKGYDLFIFPSLWEGLGIAVLEAQAVGVPVLASDVDGIRELVSTAATGLLFEAANAAAIAASVDWAITHPDRLHGIAEQARQQADGFGIDVMVQNYIQIYEEA